MVGDPPRVSGTDHRSCVKDPMFGIGVIHSQKGVLRDLDDQWLEMVCEEKKKKIIKIIRLDQISGVKEIL